VSGSRKVPQALRAPGLGAFSGDDPRRRVAHGDELQRHRQSTELDR